ncbi:unnamed protein product, partial [Mesorhabditis spiculigera]
MRLLGGASGDDYATDFQYGMTTKVPNGVDGISEDYRIDSFFDFGKLHKDGPIMVPEANGYMVFGQSPSSSPILSDSPNEQFLLEQNEPELQNGKPMQTVGCTGCKNGANANHFCKDCSHFLCENCTTAHTIMHCFAGHQVEALAAPNGYHAPRNGMMNGNVTPPGLTLQKTSGMTLCPTHKQTAITHFCCRCDVAVCVECVHQQHNGPFHNVEEIEKVVDQQLEDINVLYKAVLSKQARFSDFHKDIDNANQNLLYDLQTAKEAVDGNVKKIHAVLEERRAALHDHLDSVYAEKKGDIERVDKGMQDIMHRVDQTLEFCQRLFKFASPSEILVFKQLLDTRLRLFLVYNPDNLNILKTPLDAEVLPVDPLQTRQYIGENLAVRKPTWSHGAGPNIPSSVATSIPSSLPSTLSSGMGRPPSVNLEQTPSSYPAGFMPIGLHGNPSMLAMQNSLPSLGSSAPTNGYISNLDNPSSIMRANASLSHLDAENENEGPNPFAPFSESIPNQYPKWSSALEPSLGVVEGPDLADVDKDSAAYLRQRSGMKRMKMVYHCKFGEFGVMEGQFTEPSGVAVNAQNDIIVADTNNHRIQVFDKEGRFKFQFGECGKRDGQLLYPNRVAVNKKTGDFVVTERSPTHQIQVYNQYGQFLRKFGANILQHPRGVCVDSKGRIIVVECKVMRVIIFDMFGNILGKFSCSRHLEFPNGVCTNEKNEILISDNRAHCVKVFSYEGVFLRSIGGEGITNYPIGVGINSSGDVVVADNHNNFNLTIFHPDGTLVGALESKVKHAQCFDVALLDDHSVALASKDYRLYLYRFVPLPQH